MARHESDREDLMQEATALVRRAEWHVPAFTDPVVAGFKRNGHWSVYFGPDPVFQFDELGRLRRAFAHGVLWRTQGGTLSRLQRERAGDETRLLRQDLNATELKSFLEEVRGQLTTLLHCLNQDKSTLLRQVPANHNITAEAISILQLVLRGEIALAPVIPGKK